MLSTKEGAGGVAISALCFQPQQPGVGVVVRDPARPRRSSAKLEDLDTLFVMLGSVPLEKVQYQQRTVVSRSSLVSFGYLQNQLLKHK